MPTQKHFTSRHMDSHMNFRMSSKDKKTIEMAAELTGFKPNTYARQKLLEIAEHDIAKMNRLNSLVVSTEDWEILTQIMDAPVKINKKLKKAIADFDKMFGE